VSIKVKRLEGENASTVDGVIWLRIQTETPWGPKEDLEVREAEDIGNSRQQEVTFEGKHSHEKIGKRERAVKRAGKSVNEKGSISQKIMSGTGGFVSSWS